MNRLNLLAGRCCSGRLSVPVPVSQPFRNASIVHRAGFHVSRYVRNDANTSTSAPPEPFKGDDSLEKFLTKRLSEARKAKDTFRTNLLRTVIGELQTEQKSLSSKQGMSSEKLEQSAMKTVRKAISKRKSSAEEYRSAKRPDSAEHEEHEAAYLESLVPKQIDPETLRKSVEAVYLILKDNGFVASKPPQEVIEAVTSEVKMQNSELNVEKGEVMGALMPMLQEDGIMKKGGGPKQK